MSTSTFSTSRWLFELTKTFLKGAPISTPVSVITTLISQVSMMLAFLMPLKVVMLLGSEGVPKFFPRAFLDYDRNTLIISLVVLSIAFYFISLVFGKLSKQTAERGAKKLIANTQKIVIFENQDSLASNAYTKYTDALAGLIFSLVTIGLFSIFYPDVAALTVFFLLLAYLVTHCLYKFNTKLEISIYRQPNSVTNTISNIGFLLIFLYIVVDFLYLTPPEFIIALATIILSRLMLTRLSVTAAYFFSLKRDEGKINALFFHHHVFMPDATKQHQSIWDLLDNNLLLNWLKPVLKEASQQESREISVEWKQSRLKNIVVLQVETSDKTFLIKLFDNNISSQARHESTLLVDIADSQLPCPPFLLATKVENYHCHVFDITGHEFLSRKEAHKLNHQLNEQLLRITPPDELIERYRRSKALMWERIDTKMLGRLSLVATETEKSLILKFENAIPEIKTILQSLPLNLVNHKLNKSSLLRNRENQIVSFHWPSWVIEPAGFGLDKSAGENVLIEIASEHNSEFNKFNIHYYRIASLVAACERSFQQQQYKKAIAFLQLSVSELEASQECES